jgi:hypothetical protein
MYRYPSVAAPLHKRHRERHYTATSSGALMFGVRWKNTVYAEWQYTAKVLAA